MRPKILKHADESIRYNDRTVNFRLQLSKRRSLSIIVNLDQTVTVKAPATASLKWIKNTVEKKADWIIKKQDQFKNLPQNHKKNQDNGEIYTFLGNHYKLNIQRELVNKVYIENDELIVLTTTFNKEKIRKLINEWYKQRAHEIFHERLELLRDSVLPIGIIYDGNPRLRKMKSRWGSCSRKGHITLSYDLVKAPLKCVDYVIVHEMCHIKEFNHSKKFYILLDKVMPDWKNRRKELNQKYCC